MLVIRICPICGRIFVAKRYGQRYCCRKCFRIGHRRRSKIKAETPQCICPNCGLKQKLDFNPKSSSKKWSKYKCIKCGYQFSEGCEEEELSNAFRD
jgi:hypothetical protein